MLRHLALSKSWTAKIDLTVCAEVSDNFDLSDNFAQVSDELSPEDIMSEEGLATRTPFVLMQHDDPALSKLFTLAKAINQDKSSTFYEIRNDVLVRRNRDRISPVGLEVTQVVVPSTLCTTVHCCAFYMICQQQIT